MGITFPVFLRLRDAQPTMFFVQMIRVLHAGIQAGVFDVLLQFFDFHKLKRDDTVQINGGDFVGMFLQMTDGIQSGQVCGCAVSAPSAVDAAFSSAGHRSLYGWKAPCGAYSGSVLREFPGFDKTKHRI